MIDHEQRKTRKTRFYYQQWLNIKQSQLEKFQNCHLKYLMLLNSKMTFTLTYLIGVHKIFLQLG